MNTKVALIVVTLLVSRPAFPQANSGETKKPRETPLGTQRPKPEPPARPEEPKLPPEKPAEVVDRAAAALGGRSTLASVRDSTSEGRLTFFSPDGAKGSADVTVIRKGAGQVQRIVKQPGGELRQGSNGSATWESSGGLTVLSVGGLAAGFLESQTIRSIDNLLDSAAKGFAVRDGGAKNNGRSLEVEVPDPGKAARKTSYFIDDATSRVTRMEFVRGDAKDLFGKSVPAMESYVFSDFRNVQGVLTPFHIERYLDGLKIEETQYTSVRHNTSLKDDQFRP